MSVVFYISGHGFGHASRQIEVIDTLLERRPDIHVVVRTTVPARLFDIVVASSIELQFTEADSGVAQLDSLRIDEEVRRVIDENFVRAKGILTSSLEKLHTMADALIKYETIDEEQLKDIMAGKAPKPPADWDDSVGTPKASKRPEGGQPEGPIGTPAGQH